MMYTWIIALGIIFLGGILYTRKNRSQILKRENPLEILNRRFASGEITKKEYEERKRIINSNK
ncbi:MAG: SHOCT domain-containing protein [Lutibacter sp.]|uniref:SHOCT domain-containing protein n=1 Tax=Lutibacter sp. TaxID=1925666 RepID=UPI00299D19D9|nr:SHOCT domain-containing protein [Lutibacter sp.]MDX1828847.1 SHOCT domain-containing protein [Lutibacter sp.]